LRCCIAQGIDEATFRAEPRCYSICNTNPPLQLDLPMTDGIMEFARHGQLMIITPFTLAGAMAPITIPGALTLAHAEALFGITLSQIVRPGAPVMYGSFTHSTLAAFQPPPLDPGVHEELAAFVARHREAGGAPPVS